MVNLHNIIHSSLYFQNLKGRCHIRCFLSLLSIVSSGLRPFPKRGWPLLCLLYISIVSAAHWETCQTEFKWRSRHNRTLCSSCLSNVSIFRTLSADVIPRGNIALEVKLGCLLVPPHNNGKHNRSTPPKTITSPSPFSVP